MAQKKNKKSIIILSLLIILMGTNLTFAEKITLNEAIKLGLSQNSEIKAQKRELKNIEKELLSIKAKQNWHVDIGGNFSKTIDEKGDNFSKIIDEQNNLIMANGVKININKTLPSGLTIQPELCLKEDDFNPELQVNLSHSLLPSTPTNLQKQYWKAEKNLLIAKINLTKLKKERIISWVDTYLNLTRLAEKQELYQKVVKKAKNNLKKVKEKHKIGEAGKKELLTAEISLENARYNMIEMGKRIEETKMNFYKKLGIKDNEIILDRQNELLFDLTNHVNAMIKGHIVESDINQLMSTIEQENFNLMVNRINREIFKKEKEWIKNEGRTNATISGDYDSINNDFTIGINVSYQVYDGGEKDINLEKKEFELEKNLDQHDDIYIQLQIRLNQYLSDIELSQLKLNKNKKVLEKSELELKVAKKQLDIGLINYLDYQEVYIRQQENKLNVKSLRDSLLIDKLNLVKLMNVDQLQEVFLK